ncbi:hypothetical protein SEUCBS140593_005511 [Sporothrix eucalyptigena]|uniref:Alcohol dehydrogenase-like N-terminal domain-containing protein n=1 Tax=Sporothrix eucalyptigena TaxID=1812306 RepID=A0ABP0BXX5_9PEZI
MNAVVLHGIGDLRLDKVPPPTADPGSVVVQVISTPVWNYLPEIMDGRRTYPLTFPFTFGTYAVGRVHAVGPDIAYIQPGQLVFCDAMVYLRDSPQNFLVLGYHGGYTAQERKVSATYWRDGCFADFVRWPAENVHIVDEALLAKNGVLPAQLAEVAAIGPAMGAANSIDVTPGETVLVMPSTGFFSSSAITAVLALGANVVAGGRSQMTLDEMHHDVFGSDPRITTVVLTGDIEKDIAALIAATPHCRGAHAYIDFTPPMVKGADATHIVTGLKALQRGGRCCFAGVILDDVALPYKHIMDNQLMIKGAFACHREDTAQVLRLIEGGVLKLKKQVLGPYSLGKYKETLQLAEESRGFTKMTGKVMPLDRNAYNPGILQAPLAFKMQIKVRNKAHEATILRGGSMRGRRGS